MAFTLAGCFPAAANFTMLNPAPRALVRRQPAQVAVFSSAPPVRPHVDVGLIEDQQGDAVYFETREDLLALLRDEAAQRGCDAVVLGPPTWTGGKSSLRVYSGTCVVYTDASPIR